MTEVLTTKARAAHVVETICGTTIIPDWSGLDCVWPAFEKMAKEGAVLLVKIDGERTEKDDNGRYTVAVSGGRLSNDFFRCDTPSLEDGLAKAILHYAERCWQHVL